MTSDLSFFIVSPNHQIIKDKLPEHYWTSTEIQDYLYKYIGFYELTKDNVIHIGVAAEKLDKTIVARRYTVSKDICILVTEYYSIFQCNNSEDAETSINNVLEIYSQIKNWDGTEPLLFFLE